MSFSFVHPTALWLLLLLPLLWAFTLGARPALRRGLAQPGSSARRTDRAQSARFSLRLVWPRLLLRTLLLLALVLALAGIQLVRPVGDTTVAFLIDGSDSVSPAQREAAIAFVADALATRDQNDQAAVVVFGQNALVEWAPARLLQLDRLTSTPLASRTNIAEAIRLGLALLPADTQKRLVLLSDGRENAGRAAEAARLAAARGVPIDIVPLPGTTGPDVLVSGIDAPDTAREGQEVPLQVVLESSIATSGQLQIFADGELLQTQPVAIAPGTTRLPITIPGGEAGFRRYEVRLEAEGDAQPLNNRAAAFTTVQGPPRVLLVASAEERVAPLREALEASSVRVEWLTPEQVPANQAQLREYGAIMLVDVLARDVPRAVQEALPVYVREQGGGLAMIGGRESFGAGGWRRSPVAAALPVELDPQDSVQRPDLALVLVIDRSGSMAEGAGLGLTKLDLAKEAVYQASLGLEQRDEIGVVGFDIVANWVLPVQKLPGLADIEQALSTFNADGGTNIRSGIAPAAETLASSEARVKHVILLTDGIADSNYADLIDQMRADNVTISIVSIGANANPALREIAERGGGRFYRVDRLADVPTIFLSETVIVAGRDIIEGQFTPAVALPAPLVRGLESLPPLYGYNATEPRTTARTILVSPDSKPVLAQWQYGLGRSLAWTSDLKGQWAREWLAWPNFARFAGGMLDALLPPPQGDRLALQTRTDGARTILDVTAQDERGQPLEDVQLEGRLLGPDDQGAPLSFAQVGPGRYRAVVTTDEPGVYLAQLAALDQDGQAVGNLASGIVVAYSPEYRVSAGTTAEGTAPLLAELATATAGRQAPLPADVFAAPGQPVGEVEEIALPLLWLALVLWPLDIALRRLLLRPGDMGALVRHLPLGRLGRTRAAAPASAETTVARLQAARARRQSPPRAAPPSVPVEPSTSSPAPPPAPPRTPPARGPKPSAPPSAHPDDALASLLASRKRARRSRSPNDGGTGNPPEQGEQG